MPIIFNQRFMADRDQHGWALVERRTKVRTKDDPKGKWKAGDPYKITRQTYHGKLEHVCRHIIDMCGLSEDAKTADELRQTILLTSNEITKAISEAGLE